MKQRPRAGAQTAESRRLRFEFLQDSRPGQKPGAAENEEDRESLTHDRLHSRLEVRYGAFHCVHYLCKEGPLVTPQYYSRSSNVDNSSQVMNKATYHFFCSVIFERRLQTRLSDRIYSFEGAESHSSRQFVTAEVQIAPNRRGSQAASSHGPCHHGECGGPTKRIRRMRLRKRAAFLVLQLGKPVLHSQEPERSLGSWSLTFLLRVKKNKVTSV